MATTAVRTFKNNWLQPVMNPKEARTDACKLAPGSYLAGRVLGETTNKTGANDVQTITVDGTAGTFILTFPSAGGSASTGSLAFNITAAALQAALEALAPIGVGNVTVTGGPGSSGGGTPYVVTFVGMAAAQPQPVFTTVELVTGGGGTVTIAHTTTGNPAGGFFANYADANSDGTEVARGLLKFDTYVDNWGRHYAGGVTNGSYDYNGIYYYSGIFRTADLTGLDAAGIADLGRLIRGTSSTLTSLGTMLRMR